MECNTLFKMLMIIIVQLTIPWTLLENWLRPEPTFFHVRCQSFFRFTLNRQNLSLFTASELNKLQSEGKQLKERYDFVANNSDKLLKRMNSSKEELIKFKSEIGTFKIWMEKSYKILEDNERALANLNKLQNADGIKEFVSDVMTHAADLKFLSMSGQKYVQLSKVCSNNVEI